MIKVAKVEYEFGELPETEQAKVLNFVEALDPHPRVRQGRYWDGKKEMEWLARNRAAYLGLWVALDGDRLVAADPDALKVYKAAKAEGVEIPFLKHILPDEPHTSGWVERVG